MKKPITIIAIVLIITGAINAVCALVMIGVASKNPEMLTTSIQESRIDDLAREEGYQSKISQTYTIYLIISLVVVGLGIFAFFYLKNLSVKLFPSVQIKFGDTFLWSSKAKSEK